MKRTNLVLMISAALTLAACGGNSSNDSAPSDPTPPKTAQPTPKPTPTPETSEQEAEKPEAKKPATGGSSGGSGGSYAGGGSYGGSSGSTGGAGGDTGSGDETGDSDKTDDGDEDKGGEETVKELTDEQIQAFANSGNNSFIKAGDADLANEKAVKVGDKWNGYYLKSEKTEENPNPAEVVLMPTAESNTEAVKTTIKTAEVRKWGDIETATTRITQGEKTTGTDYLSKAYSYSRFGIKVDGEIADGAIKSEGKEVTYYSVGDIGSLIPNASEPPAHGEAKYLGVAFLNATVNDSLVNTIGTFEGHAKFSKKEFEGSISGLRTYETLALLAEGKTKKMGDDAKTQIYGADAKKIKFTAEIKGHHLVNDGSADPGIKVDGAFYGPEAAEVGGMISKENAFDGVFGGEKIKDAAPAE